MTTCIRDNWQETRSTGGVIQLKPTVLPQNNSMTCWVSPAPGLLAESHSLHSIISNAVGTICNQTQTHVKLPTSHMEMMASKSRPSLGKPIRAGSVSGGGGQHRESQIPAVPCSPHCLLQASSCPSSPLSPGVVGGGDGNCSTGPDHPARASGKLQK